jgi:short-subunit dehydrogenase
VIAAARSADLLEELAGRAKSAGYLIVPIVADVTQPADRRRLVEAALEHLGGLDLLVNNAAVGATGHFVDAAPDRLRTIMEVNFFAVTEMTRIFLPLLRSGHKPAIVNISSIAGKRGIPARAEYSASKFALQGFSEALRAELTKNDIDVIVVAPGLTQTNFSRNMLEQKALMPVDHLRGMTAEAVADVIVGAIESGRNEVILTLQGKLLAWVARFLPRLADRIAARKVRALFREEIERRERQA